MRPLHTRIVPFLLVALVVTWGTCPCVFAKMVRAGLDPAAAEAPACCCKQEAPASEDAAPQPGSPQPGDRDCPCCKRGGWMRDLPPQVQPVLLEAPDLAAFDLPALDAAAAAACPLDRLAPEQATGPPEALRPHAAPVGIVRLLN